MKNRVIAFAAALVIFPVLSGCELNYLVKSSVGQLNLMSKKESFDKALEDPKIDDETKRKIKLVQKVKKFAEDKLALSHTSNYESIVMLNDRYVTYAVTASQKDKLEPYLWSFPFVGKVPYKGYFNKQDAIDESDKMKKKNFDVMVRGVSAYSTLGWFSDPLLSSMLQDEDYVLVDTIIHETTHATIYIKSNAEFNERLATFVGEKGTELFYKSEEGASSPTAQKMELSNHDSKIFFDFMTEEIKAIEAFYASHKGDPQLFKIREAEFQRIKNDYIDKCRPKLKTDQFDYFGKMTINNAVLIGYKMYFNDLGIFEKLFEKSSQDWNRFFGYLVTIKKSDHPEEDLKSYLNP